MAINYRIPTSAEVEEILASTRQDYSEIYKLLAIHGSVIYDELPDRMRSAIYNHYRYVGLPVRIVKTKDAKFMVSLLQDAQASPV